MFSQQILVAFATQTNCMVQSLNKSLEAGNASAMYDLGESYAYGRGVTQDVAQAVFWYRKAAEAGNSNAMLSVALAYAKGTLLEKDDVKAFQWSRKAFDAGNMKATTFLHDCYYAGKGTEKNLEKAKQCLMAGVKAGDADAMCYYGSRKHDSKTGNITEPPKTDWLIKAAEAGSRQAMLMLGVNYANGIGVKKDQEEAFKWYLKAAENGSSLAMWQVSNLYLTGEGVAKNDEKVAQWCIAAAENGESDAMVNAGVAYYKGIGVRKNQAYAVKWFLKGAENGDERAMSMLALCYEKGEGVKKDQVEAFKWMRKAADQGFVEAIGGVGLSYLEGQGVPQNDFLAYVWLSLAAAKGINGTITVNGLKGTTTWRDQARARLSPELVYKAQQLALYWFENGTAEADVATIPKKDSSDSASPINSGTGFFVTSDGYLLTAAHVVAKGNNARVLVSGKTLSAKVVRIDEGNDLALLKVSGTFTALPLKSSTAVKLGMETFTIGFPNIQLQGASPKLTKGSVSGLNGIKDDPTRFQISVTVQPGNSGGPLVDFSGSVIGVLAARLNDIATANQTGMLPQNVNYAIKADYAFPLLNAVPKDSPRARTASGLTFDNAASLVERAVCIVLVYQ
jgi:TPR repeat protein